MPKQLQIRCIVRTNSGDYWDQLQAVGGIDDRGLLWQLSVDQAIRGHESGKYSFVVDIQGRAHDVVVAKSRHGHKYLKTFRDDYRSRSLMDLPECP